MKSNCGAFQRPPTFRRVWLLRQSPGLPLQKADMALGNVAPELNYIGVLILLLKTEGL